MEVRYRSWASPMQQHLSVVPYQGHGSGRPHGCGYCPGECCAPFYPSHCSQQSLQVALPMTSTNIEERLRALEGDKDQLHIQVKASKTNKDINPFQVTVLSDQVESQTEKITDLERVLDDKQGTLQKTEDVLARELLEKSALETARLGLLSEITDMRLRQVNQFSNG